MRFALGEEEVAGDQCAAEREALARPARQQDQDDAAREQQGGEERQVAPLVREEQVGLSEGSSG